MGVIDKITPLTPGLTPWVTPSTPGGAKRGERLYYYVVKGKPPPPPGGYG